MEDFPYYNPDHPEDIKLGEIVDFNITISEQIALTAVLIIMVGGRRYAFGGRNLMGSIPSIKANSFFSHFIFRCMQISRSNEIMQMNGTRIWVTMEDDIIMGIGYERSGDWFYPAEEFMRMENL